MVGRRGLLGKRSVKQDKGQRERRALQGQAECYRQRGCCAQAWRPRRAAEGLGAIKEASGLQEVLRPPRGGARAGGPLSIKRQVYLHFLGRPTPLPHTYLALRVFE